RPPEATVLRRAAVVAHHEVVVLRDPELARQRALVARPARPDVAVLLALAVADDVAADDLDAVARDAHDALDEVHVGAVARGQRARLVLRLGRAALVGVRAARRVEDEDVSDL